MSEKTVKDEAFDKFAEFLERGRKDDNVHTYVAIMCSQHEDGARMEITHNLIDDSEAFRLLNGISSQVLMQMNGVTKEQYEALMGHIRQDIETISEDDESEKPVTKH